jgi:hypothetical protein
VIRRNRFKKNSFTLEAEDATREERRKGQVNARVTTCTCRAEHGLCGRWRMTCMGYGGGLFLVAGCGKGAWRPRVPSIVPPRTSLLSLAQHRTTTTNVTDCNRGAFDPSRFHRALRCQQAFLAASLSVALTGGCHLAASCLAPPGAYDAAPFAMTIFTYTDPERVRVAWLEEDGDNGFVPEVYLSLLFVPFGHLQDM